MSGRERIPPLALVASILASGSLIPYVLLTGLAADTPFWAWMMGFIFPASALTVFVWYVRRHVGHRDSDLLFEFVGRGSALGGTVLAAVGVVIVLLQRSVGRPIVNPEVLILQLWVGGSLIGLGAGHLYASVVAEKTRLTALLDATEDLVLESDTAAIAERTVTAADRIIGMDTSAVYTPEDDTTLEPLATTEGTVDVFGHVPTIESRDAIAWSVFESGDPVIVDDVREHPDVYNPDTPVRSEMIIPLGDVGVFMAASADVGVFNETDRLLAELLISNAEAVLGRAVNEAALRERERKLERLQRRSQRLMYTQTRERTVRSAIEAARDVIDAPYTGVHLLNEAGDTLEGGAISEAASERFGEAPDYHRDSQDESADAVVWEVFESGGSLYVEDTDTHDRLSGEPRSRCVLVYSVGDHGVFIASGERPRSFDNTDQILFELLATSLTSALDRVEKEQTLRRRKARMERHRQRLTVLNRVLRHDIRNNASVVLGAISELKRTFGDAAPLETIERQNRKIVELSDNARRIERTIDNSDQTTTAVDVTGAVEANIDELRSTMSPLEVHAEMPDEAHVVSNGLIEAAVENVLTNAVEHNDSNPPVVRVTVAAESEDDEVVIRVADNGPGIPADERDVFAQKEETQLQHSSGIGLWLVHWIIEDLDGSVEIEDRQPRGTIVRLRVPRPATPEL